MFKHAPLLLLLLAPFATPAAAQDERGRAQLTVILTDTLDRPVPAVRVVVNGVAPALTDAEGVARVTGIPLGARMVAVDHPGYRHEDALVQFPSANNFRLRITLTPVPITLDTLNVASRPFNVALHQTGFYKRQQEGQGQYLTRETMNEVNRSSADLSPAFRRIAGLRVETGTTGVPFTLRSSRGEGNLDENCVPGVRIDGVRADLEQLATLAPAHVEAIEVYRGAAGAPPEYADAGSSCGMILVWLRR